jgi:poly(3-hydroxybutyrate) depolymerase
VTGRLARSAVLVALVAGLTAGVAVAAEPPACTNEPTGGTTVRSPYAPREVEAGLQAVWAETALPGDDPFSYLIHVPDVSTLPAGPVPVVMTIHGLLGNAKQHLTQTQWADAADREGFIVVAPNGRRSWDNSQGSADVEFVRDVIADVRMRNCVDARRIYVTGHSNGGFMTNRLACESGDLFAAAASYAGGDVDGFPQESPCTGDGLDADGAPVPGFAPVPIGMWHGDDDAIVSYQADRRNLRSWLRRDDCDTSPARRTDEFGSWETYPSCTRGGFDLVFRTLAGHGHAWPDGCGGQQSTGGTVDCTPEAGTGPWPAAADLTRELWAFLSAHVRAQPAVDQGAPSVGAPPGPQPDDAAAWAGGGLSTNIDSDPAFRRDGPLAATANELSVSLVLRVATGGDAAGIGPTHPVCPTAARGPSTQSMPDRTAGVSAEDVDGVRREVTVPTEPAVVTTADGTVEHVERVVARIPGRFDPAATVLRAWTADDDTAKFWWACGRPAAFYKETLTPAPCAVAPERRPPGVPAPCPRGS